MALKGEYSKSLEISLRATARGFESHPLRQIAANGISFAAIFYFHPGPEQANACFGLVSLRA